MSGLPQQKEPPKMLFDEFIEWAEQQDGKWELHEGIPVRLHDPAKMQSERARHARAKSAVFVALQSAVTKTNSPCEVFPDGMSVQISDEKSYEPDALVYCGDKIGGDELVVPNPVILVEVLSPSTAHRDISEKLRDYFTLASVQHYLIVNPVLKSIQHHFRQDDKIEINVFDAGPIQLSPPGLSINVEEVFES